MLTKKILMVLMISSFAANAEQFEIDLFLDKNPELYELDGFVSQLSKFDEIKCGSKHCYATKDGDLYSGGYNTKGQLGLGKITKKPKSWTKVKNITRVKQFEAFSDYGILTTNWNQIMAVGDGRSGMIGLPEKKDYKNFTEVKIKGFNKNEDIDVEIIMTERTTFIKNKKDNKYFATGGGYDQYGNFAVFDQTFRMGFIPIRLEGVNNAEILAPEET